MMCGGGEVERLVFGRGGLEREEEDTEGLGWETVCQEREAQVSERMKLQERVKLVTDLLGWRWAIECAHKVVVVIVDSGDAVASFSISSTQKASSVLAHPPIIVQVLPISKFMRLGRERARGCGRLRRRRGG